MLRHSFKVKSRSEATGTGNTQELAQCMITIDDVPGHSNTSAAHNAVYESCYTSRAVTLATGDVIWVEDDYSRYVYATKTATFWGIVKL